MAAGQMLRAAEPPGTLDSAFSPTLDGSVFAVAVQLDGRILIGGEFTKVNGGSRGHLARLNPDGTLDDTFGSGSGANTPVHAIAVQDDGRIVVAGDFSAIHGAAWTRIARLNPDGSPDATFNQGAFPNGRVLTVAIQPDGRILLGGAFTQVGGVTRNFLARLNINGSLDGSFNAHADSHVYAIALRIDGKLVIGGDFAKINNVSHRSIAQLNSDGTTDSSFVAETDTTVYALALQPDGQVVAVGAFGRVNGAWQDGVARLNQDGSRDVTFNAGISGNGSVAYALSRQPDGKVIVAGYFREVNGTSKMNVGRLNTNGLLDTTFDAGAGPDYRVRAIALQGDGKILLGGEFTTVNFADRTYLARVAGDPAPPSGVPLTSEIWTAVEIGWNSETNRLYQVQWSSEAEPAVWHNLGTAVPGNGEATSVFDSRRVSPRRFYRVLKMD